MPSSLALIFCNYAAYDGTVKGLIANALATSSRWASTGLISVNVSKLLTPEYFSRS